MEIILTVLPFLSGIIVFVMIFQLIYHMHNGTLVGTNKHDDTVYNTVHTIFYMALIAIAVAGYIVWFNSY